jgi:hypothetical protein
MAHSEHFVGLVVERVFRRLVYYDAFAARIDERVRRAEVDG